MGIEKITRYFTVRIYLFQHFRRGQNLEYNFPLGTIFGPIFPVERVPSGSGEGGGVSLFGDLELYGSKGERR